MDKIVISAVVLVAAVGVLLLFVTYVIGTNPILLVAGAGFVRYSPPCRAQRTASRFKLPAAASLRQRRDPRPRDV